MTFLEAIKSGFENYTAWRGRASRSEYWWWMLFVAILTVAAAVLDAAIFHISDPDKETGPFGAIVSLGLFLPSLAVSIRRLHDVDRPAWWVLTIIPPFIWSFKKGDDAINRFGPNPLQGAMPRR